MKVNRFRENKKCNSALCSHHVTVYRCEQKENAVQPPHYLESPLCNLDAAHIFNAYNLSFFYLLF